VPNAADAGFGRTGLGRAHSARAAPVPVYSSLQRGSHDLKGVPGPVTLFRIVRTLSDEWRWTDAKASFKLRRRKGPIRVVAINHRSAGVLSDAATNLATPACRRLTATYGRARGLPAAGKVTRLPRGELERAGDQDERERLRILASSPVRNRTKFTSNSEYHPRSRISSPR
jgi:hypothetical protein